MALGTYQGTMDDRQMCERSRTERRELLLTASKRREKMPAPVVIPPHLVHAIVRSFVLRMWYACG